jgi:hypothetical protein
VFSISDRITNDILEESLQDTTSLLIDKTRDTLDASTTSETTNGGLGNALNVITKNLALSAKARQKNISKRALNDNGSDDDVRDA